MSNSITSHKWRLSPDQFQRAEAAAFSFDGYLDWYELNGPWQGDRSELMRRKYGQIQIPGAEREALLTITGDYRLLAMVDVGCPWVAANLTIVARVVEATPRIQLRVLHRPQHLDIAYAYPGSRGAGSFVLFDESGDECAAHGGTLGAPREVLDLTVARREARYREFSQHYPGVHVMDLPHEYISAVLKESMEWRWGFLDQERAGVVQWLLNATARGRLSTVAMPNARDTL